MISSARARRVSAAVAATVLGLSVVATAVPASAESRTLKDGRGDTFKISGSEPSKAPGHPEADLRKLVIKHTARKVVISSQFQNLRQVGDGTGVSLNLDTPSDASYNAGVYGQRGNWKGAANFYASDGVACNPRHTMNYRKDVVTLSIPTSCLTDPAWVRVQLYGIHTRSQSKVFADNAHNGKFVATYTHRVERG